VGSGLRVRRWGYISLATDEEADTNVDAERRTDDQDGVLRRCATWANRQWHSISARKSNIFFVLLPADEAQIGAKYVFVRVLGKSRHLQANTVVHWGTWFACTTILGALAFVLASAIPIFNYLIALVGSVCFAPLAMSLPGWLWLHSHGHYRKGTLVQKIVYLLHIGLVLLGLFFLVGATYGVIQQIIDAYDTGLIGMSLIHGPEERLLTLYRIGI
jgi:hypothetical protein